ncbi:ral guanine nucleotide dissociation stimulator-like 1 [Patagioenas fasciata]|uniref:ral guanine nucleotide dissociation stimulator-like 1 n=1 Tax=Patagioenas fasciata TaxID=372321 RepID=UPI003A9984DD
MSEPGPAARPPQARNFPFRNLSLWRCWRRPRRRTPRQKRHEEDVESLHSLEETLTKPTKEEVESPECTEEPPERVEETPERIEQTLSETREEDVETTSKVSDKDAETPERVENGLSKATEEDTETAECTEETPSEPTEEDVETPQSLEENVRNQPGEDVEVPQSVQESTTEDGAEDAQEGAVDCDSLRRAQIQQTDSEGARWLGAEGDQFPAGHTVSPDETCNSRALKAGTLEKLVETLPTAFADNDFTYISIFLSTYRAFASTSTVLELLLDRYGNLEISGSEEHGTQNSPGSSTVLRTAMASILQAWLDQCADDFREPPDYVCLQKVLSYLKKNMPGSDPEKRAQNLLEQFQKEEWENDDAFHSLSPCTPDEEEELEISGPEEFSLSQEDLVAEQLTYMDATLFQNVVPHHCLGCIWSRRDKKENKQLAQSIRATISQFNAVTNCVLSTILESKELKTQPRAKILEKWIRIGRQCRILNNFSSLKAIVSALQSTSVYRRKKTRACVPKDTMLMFEELCEIFSDCDNFATSRELLLKGVTQGTVPYLGTFLTDLVMLDTALQDYLEVIWGNFWNPKSPPSLADTVSAPARSGEGFRLSREIEGAAPDQSTAAGRAQKSVVKRFSLPFLGLGVSALSTPVNAQPKPAPGGSSGDSTVTIVPPTDTAEEPQHKCSKKCPGPVTPVPSKEVPPVLPVYNQQSGASCVIRTSVEEDRSGNIYRSILLSNQEKAPAVTQRAMEKHNLQSGSAEDYELVQIISEDEGGEAELCCCCCWKSSAAFCRQE